ncbi:COMM domain-containing protein 2-like [Vespa mandarinia]|uniref:COMM domain-containing protein 2-like n=1 Tax=Vespa mandarinia TaxID=7446 RepID=UPI0016122D02|nr:COMM domain-containing protein 2-like [Vespa mandarinia]XP_046836024.1 COMM domain-containing protein 2 [Vespa crabro]XP_047365873.1 COMM domain-containing protein 2 [Vespa velutina]
MLLTLRPDHKKHVLFLIEQTPQVLQDFCKLALDYLQKGPNMKLYYAAAQKLEVEVDVIKNSVEGLINLLLESCNHKLSNEDFRDSIIALGFSEENEAILSKLYITKNKEISNILSATGFKIPEYHDLEWRFEVQTASRTLLKQVSPLITLDLTLKNNENMEHILLQTDPVNLLHMAQELEEALKEGYSQHTRQVSRVAK